MEARKSGQRTWVVFGIAAVAVGALSWVLIVPSTQSTDLHVGAADLVQKQRDVDMRLLGIGLPAADSEDLDQLHPLVDELPASAGAVEPEAAPDEKVDRHVYRDGNPYRMYVAPQVFAERYADASLEELQSARSAIEKQVHESVARAGNEFLDAGRGEFELIPRAESLDQAATAPAEESFGLINTRRTQVTAGGELAVEKGRLPWEEYKSVYDIQDELFWLMREIRKRERDVAASGAAGTATK